MNNHFFLVGYKQEKKKLEKHFFSKKQFANKRYLIAKILTFLWKSSISQETSKPKKRQKMVFFGHSQVQERRVYKNGRFFAIFPFFFVCCFYDPLCVFHILFLKILICYAYFKNIRNFTLGYFRPGRKHLQKNT